MNELLDEQRGDEDREEREELKLVNLQCEIYEYNREKLQEHMNDRLSSRFV